LGSKALLKVPTAAFSYQLYERLHIFWKWNLPTQEHIIISGISKGKD